MPKTGRRPCRSPRPASVTRLRPTIRDTARKDKAARQAAADRKGTPGVWRSGSTVAPYDGFGSSTREAIRGSLAGTTSCWERPGA
ncbi:MAG: hypothetical protein ACLSHC_08200 [Bilophila wadsworthia]